VCWVTAWLYFIAGFNTLRDYFLEGIDILFNIIGEGLVDSEEESNYKELLEL
jgi:hypothetical protein